MADDASADSKLRGKVKWFNDAKGFGFIEHTSGRDVFVHFSSIQSDGFKTLKDGDEVEYEMKEGPKGFHATKVQRLARGGAESSAENQEGDSNQDGDSMGNSEANVSELHAEASAPADSSELASNAGQTH